MESERYKTWKEMATAKSWCKKNAKIRQMLQDLHENWPNFFAPTFSIILLPNLYSDPAA